MYVHPLPLSTVGLQAALLPLYRHFRCWRATVTAGTRAMANEAAHERGMGYGGPAAPVAHILVQTLYP